MQPLWTTKSKKLFETQKRDLASVPELGVVPSFKLTLLTEEGPEKDLQIPTKLATIHHFVTPHL